MEDKEIERETSPVNTQDTNLFFIQSVLPHSYGQTIPPDLLIKQKLAACDKKIWSNILYPQTNSCCLVMIFFIANMYKLAKIFSKNALP
jgi:hypothetical protein